MRPRRDLVGKLNHPLHRRRFADNLIEAEFARQVAAHRIDLLTQFSGLDAVADRHLKLVQVDGLADEVSAAAQRRDSVFDEHVGRDHNHDGLRLAFLDLAQRIKSQNRPAG